MEQLRIERVAFGGAGIGRRAEGMICFVPFTIPGELVSVQVTREKKSYAEANLIEVLEPSSDREQPRCPVFGRCGGCHYQHIKYERQLQIKQSQVVEAFQRIAKLEVEVSEPRPSPEIWAYRNRITVHTRQGQTGFFAPASRRVVPIDSCPIASDQINQQLQTYLGKRPRDGEKVFREPQPYKGFTQVNPNAAAILLETVLEHALSGGKFVDAYCGAGFFTQPLSERFQETVGIEWSSDAVAAAARHASATTRYIEGNVAEHLADELAGASLLVLDPPAAGCGEPVMKLVAESNLPDMIYVSCNPSTLARDIRLLGDQYRVESVVPVDMFPQTAEIEVVCKLKRM